ncbi:MAG: hypothetical protein KZQ83_08960 [gamma proteobacterium symbiont of Taylorina sp.]|nr:hypothetical protein [gamma proteobacterium symbiont of Taylorina sp.]
MNKEMIQFFQSMFFILCFFQLAFSSALAFDDITIDNEPGKWEFEVSETGYWEVVTRTPEFENDTEQARFKLSHTYGIDSKIIEQNTTANIWNSLGLFHFEKENHYFVALENQSEFSNYEINNAINLFPVDYSVQDLDDTQAEYYSHWFPLNWDDTQFNDSIHVSRPGRGLKTATWFFSVANDGRYKLYTRAPSDPSLSTSAPFYIKHANGETKVDIDQSDDGGQLKSLGEYEFQSHVDYSVTLSNDDQGNYFVADAIRIVQSDVTNQTPVAWINTSSDNGNQIQTGDTVYFDASASSDPEGDPLSYYWSLDKPEDSQTHLSGSGVNTSLTLDSAGFFQIGLVVDDGRLTSEPFIFPLTVTEPEPNIPPIAEAGANITINRIETIYLDGSASIDPEGDPLTYQWTIAQSPTGSQVQITAANTPMPSIDVDLPGAYDVQLRVHDGQQYSDYGHLIITVTNTEPPEEPLPDDPSTRAPPINPDLPEPMVNSVQFLYTGDNPIQTNVTPESIDSNRVAVIRGQVLDRQNSPLSHVEITIKNHPEFGRTLSRSDGRFDMAVNGGGQLTVSYHKAGYLSADRKVKTTWEAYVQAADVILIALDPQVTHITMASNNSQLAKGSIINDRRGIRQAAILFPSGTMAQMVLPDGTTQPIETLSVRATEYTVGDNGSLAMPAPLPASSAYTYAVDLSIDEAIQAGAQRVTFNQPVSVYVDNFLDFPVGGIVPVGFYDKSLDAWVPSDNGKVIAVVSVTEGLANIDIDGSGVPASVEALAAIGINNAEREQLAAYDGKSVWRFQVTHFTPWDCNWPYQLPEPFISPPPQPFLEDDPCAQTSGSVIDCISQSLGENIPVKDTPFFINYNSAANRSDELNIVLTKDELPSTLKQIKLNINVSGQQFNYEFEPETNKTFSFKWNGQDAYGREIASSSARIEVGYVYDAVYIQPSSTENSFAQIPPIGIRLESVRETTQIIIWDKFQQHLIHRTLFNNMTLSPYHLFSPGDKKLYRGDGSTQYNHFIMDTVELNECSENYVFYSADIDFWEDGSLYFSGPYNTVERRNADGSITRIAGGGSQSSSGGDNVPALSIGFGWISSISAAPDQSVYLVEDWELIRKIDKNGIVMTIAGKPGFTGSFSEVSNGGSALDARFNQIVDLTIGDDGSLYILNGEEQGSSAKIYRIFPNGTIVLFAGGNTQEDIRLLGEGLNFFNGDYYLNRWGDMVFHEGSLFYARSLQGKNSETNSYRKKIIKIGSDGIKTELDFNSEVNNLLDIFFTSSPEGLYVFELISIDNTPGNEHNPDTAIISLLENGVFRPIRTIELSNYAAEGSNLISVVGFDRTPDKQFFVSTNQTVYSCVYQHGYNNGTQVISQNGQELYHFNDFNQHEKTIDLLTGVTDYEFIHENGKLTEIHDRHGNVTQIVRTGEQAPHAIIAPNGKQTEIHYNADKQVSQIRYDSGESYAVTYDAEDFIDTFTDPMNHTAQMDFDAQGRLIYDENAGGGFWRLRREETDNGFTVNKTSAENRQTRYEVSKANGAVNFTTINPDNSIRQENTRDDIKTIQDEQGTLTTITQAVDPWWKNSKYARQIQVKQPSGNTMTVAIERSIEKDRTDPNANWFNFITRTQTRTINAAATWTTVNHAVDKTQTTTTPEGRERTTVFNEKGNIAEIRVPGIESVFLSYDPEGRLESLIQGQGETQRKTMMSYYDSGDQKGYLSTFTTGSYTDYFQYDHSGAVDKQTRSDGKIIAYDFNANGYLTALTPPGKAEHRFNYTDVDLTEDYLPPLLADLSETQTHYDYNLDKQLERITRPDSKTIEFIHHDSTGQLSQILTPVGHYQYTYLSSGQIDTIAAPGEHVLDYGYDGQQLSSINLSGEVNGLLEMDYNAFFQLSELRLNSLDLVPDAEDFIYDRDGLLLRAGELSLTNRADNGLPETSTLGTLSTQYRYNSFGETQTFSANHTDTLLYSVDYGIRDTSGRLVDISESIENESRVWHYDYDVSGRLEKVSLDGVLINHYGFDDNGNRVMLNGVTLAIYDEQDRLKSYGTTEYSYNANGDLSSKTEHDSGAISLYNYDVFGNLRQVELPDVTIDYVIDGQNRRVGKKIDGVLVQGLLYQDNLNPVAELDGLGNVVSRFVYANKINVPAYMIKGGIRYRIVSDHLGSPRLVVNATTGEVVQWMDYDEYGNILNDSNPGFQPFGFAGGIYDRDTNLIRFGARDYDPVTGRWTAKDPIGFEGGLNVYAYVENNPVNFIDPSGQDIWVEGPSHNEVAGHQSINIGDINGHYNSYGFAINEGGTVYEDLWRGGDVVEDMYMETTPEMDRQAVKDIIRDWDNDSSRPYFWETCRSYSQRRFNRFMDELPGNRLTTPPRR